MENCQKVSGGTQVFDVKVMLLAGNEDLPLPVKMSAGSSGFDLRAAVGDTVEIEPGKWKLIPTGIAVSMPVGLEAQVRPRSGLALKYGITVLNTPGTIDADYRGEIQVILVNLGSDIFTVRRGERIAQLVFAATLQVEVSEVADLGGTTRGVGGFGSTGTGRERQTD
jgi:dUTP pyrophosphatase